FDSFLDKHPILTWLADCVYGFLQWVDRTHYFAKLAKHSSKTFLRCTAQIEAGAVELAAKRGCDAVCCGHTHVAAAREDGPVAYYNSGCWTELPCSYLTVQGGAVNLHASRPEAVTRSAARPAPVAVG